MIKITVEEFDLMLTDLIGNEDALNFLENNWIQISPFIFHVNALEFKNYTEAVESIREYYLKNKYSDLNITKVKKYAEMIGDGLIKAGVKKAADLQAEYSKSPIQFYYYDYFDDAVKNYANYGKIIFFISN